MFILLKIECLILFQKTIKLDENFEEMNSDISSRYMENPNDVIGRILARNEV